MHNLLILGAGGHGKVTAEAAGLQGIYDEIAFLDDRSDIKKVYDFDVIGKINDYYKLIENYQYAFVAIGNNEVRIRLIDKLIDAGFKVPVIVHPKAFVSKYSSVEEGTVVLAGAVVNTNTHIEKGCILNINSCVDHDCDIGCGVHISSGAIIRSMVKIGALSNIEAGVCVKSGTILKEKSNLK